MFRSNSNTRNATNAGFASYPVTAFTFPQGRQTVNAYDLLYRRTEVGDAGSWRHRQFVHSHQSWTVCSMCRTILGWT